MSKLEKVKEALEAIVNSPFDTVIMENLVV